LEFHVPEGFMFKFKCRFKWGEAPCLGRKGDVDRGLWV
jgi:hypothetical protein